MYLNNSFLAEKPNTSLFEINPYNHINHGAKGFFQFEIMTNVLVSSFCFIWIPVLWVYDQYNFFNSSSAGAVFRRQILTSKDDPSAESVPLQNSGSAPDMI